MKSNKEKSVHDARMRARRRHSDRRRGDAPPASEAATTAYRRAGPGHRRRGGPQGPRAGPWHADGAACITHCFLCYTEHKLFFVV